MWHTLMALPGQSNLARNDLYGLRPRPSRRPLEDKEILQPRMRTLIPHGISVKSSSQNNSGHHVTSVTQQTLQTRMAAAAAEAAAVRARVTKRL